MADRATMGTVSNDRRRAATILGANVLGLLALIGPGQVTRAADHSDAPPAVSEPAEDLGDLYAWTTTDGTLAVILTYAPGIPGGGDIVADPDLLYTLYFETNGDESADLIITVRFGQNPQNDEWGVQVRHLPGAGSDLVGPIGETIDGPGLSRAYVDVVDDPFFADLTGWTASLTNQALSFDTSNDDQAGTNAMAIVLEMDRDLVFEGNTPIELWASVGRAP